MSENLYRKKIFYDDGLLLHIINTKGRTYFSLSNKHREAGLTLLTIIGANSYRNSSYDSIISVECSLEDIKHGIELINGGHFNYDCSEEILKQIKNDLIDMKETLEKENEDLFILYSL